MKDQKVKIMFAGVNKLRWSWASCLLVSGLMLHGGEESEKKADKDIKLYFEFKGAEAMSGWGKTVTTTPSPDADYLGLTGNGWDSKIFHSISLPAGQYTFSACGKGRVLNLTLRDGWDKKRPLFEMNLSRDDWRTDWRPFVLERPMKNGILLVNVGDKDQVAAAIKWIRIEASPVIEEPNLPPAAELEKSRPVPATVRGCTLLDGDHFNDLHKWGANISRYVIRLKPELDKQGLATYAPDWEKQLDKVEQYLLAARASGVKVVLFLDGSSFADQYSATSGEFWSDPGLAPLMGKVWQGIAQRLLSYRDVIWGYDLFNEPLDWTQMPNPPKQWREIAKSVIRDIRTVDQQTWIIYECGPGGLCWGFAGLKPLPDTRIIYSGHFYEPHEFTHQGVFDLRGTDLAEIKAKTGVRYPGTVNGIYWCKDQIRSGLTPVREFQLKYRVPILIGEFSVIRWAPKEDAAAYLGDVIEICEEYQWSWIYHGFREWHGWSAEHDETFAVHDAKVAPVNYETERAKVIKRGLARNSPASQ